MAAAGADAVLIVNPSYFRNSMTVSRETFLHGVCFVDLKIFNQQHSVVSRPSHLPDEEGSKDL
jgi:hypothetical protein